MAYNPFNIFRKNQKAIFAVVTVIIMFVFVMSSGLGGGADFFDWLPRMLGTQKSKQGEVLCTLNGEKVYDGELYRLRRDRAMANQFMVLAASEAVNNIMQEQEQTLPKIPESENKRLITQGLGALFQLSNRQQFLAQFGPQASMFLRQAETQLQKCYELVSAPSATAIEKDFVRTMMFQQMLGDVLTYSRGEQYFLSAPNQSQTDRLNYLLWQKKADELGIQFTDDDLKNLISSEFHGFFKDDRPIRKAMAQHFTGFNMEICLRAIAQEFRVRTAQLTVLGPGMVFVARDRAFNGNTMFASPYGLFEYYRDECSPTAYGALSVPDAAFIDKVTGEPTEDELKHLYDEYKSQEPNPARETPGFKIPRMVKLEWVSATGEEPYYQKLAEESLKTGVKEWIAGSFMTVPLPGSGPGWAAVATAPLVIKDPLLVIDSVQNEYNRDIKEAHFSAMLAEWPYPFVTRLLPTSVVRPATLVSALGGIAGGSLAGVGPLPGIGTFEVAVRAFELRDRILAQAPLFLGAVPGPGMFGAVMGGNAAMQIMLPKPLTIETVKPELMKHLTEHTARYLMLEDMKTFNTEATKLSEPKTEGKDKDKEKKAEPKLTPAQIQAAVQKYVDPFTAKRGWKRGGSQKLEGEFTIEEDPGLAPLKESLAKTRHGNEPVHFGRKFFWNEASMRGPPTAATGLYKPEYYPGPPSPFESPTAKPEAVFVVWRTEETKGKEAEGFQVKAMQDKLKAAWKRIKARELAKQRADQIAAIVHAAPGDAPGLVEQTLNDQANLLRSQIADPKVKEMVKVFKIDNVCPLSPADASGFGMGGLRPYFMAETTDIPYPTKAMADALLADRTKPPKTTLVLADSPKDTYYVATVEVRKERTLSEFQRQVYSDMGQMAGMLGQTRQIVLMAYDRELQKQTMESVMGLLKQEFKLEMTDEQKKKVEEKDKGGNEEF